MELLVPIGLNIVLGVLVWWLLPAQRAPTPLGSTGEALNLFRARFPRSVGEVTLALDGRGALIDLGAQRTGLLLPQGRRWNARLLEPHDLRRVSVQGEALELQLRDVGWPLARVALGAAAAEQWNRRLSAREPAHA